MRQKWALPLLGHDQPRDQNGPAVWMSLVAFGVGSLLTLVTKEMWSAGYDLFWPARMVIDAQRK